MKLPSQELTSEDQELIEFARQIVDANTDGASGVHTMGAAVRGVDGQMYGGINLFHFTGGPCAELVALGHARASGARELSIRVVLPTPDGVRSVKITDLMPLGAVWTPDEGTLEFDPAIFDDPSRS